MPLESLILSVKACLPHIASLQEALARLLSPPTQQAVAAAVQSLKVETSQPGHWKQYPGPMPARSCFCLGERSSSSSIADERGTLVDFGLQIPDAMDVCRYWALLTLRRY